MSTPKEIRFQIVVKEGVNTTATIQGRERVLTAETMTVGDAQRIPEVEAFLERLTGLRFHIEQMHE